MRLKLLTIGAIALGTVAGLTLAISFWAMQEWVAPYLPSLYMGIALIAIYVPTGYWWFKITKEELERGIGGGGESAEERGLKRLVGLVLQVLAGVTGLFIVSLWNFDVVRMMVIQDLPDRNEIRIGRALLDSSPMVREAACKAAFDDGATGAISTMVAGLDSAPSAAANCLTHASEKKAYGHELLAKRLVDGWESQLMGATERTAADSCQVVPHLPIVASLTDTGGGELLLLQCAMASGSSIVRTCCANQLKSQGDVLEKFGLAEDVPPDVAIRMLPALVNQTFRPLTLEAEEQTLGQSLSMDAEASRRWVFELSCNSFGRGEDRDVVRALVPLMESQSCNIGNRGRLIYADPEAWEPVCERVMSVRSNDVEADVCDAITDGLVGIAVANARAAMRVSVGAMVLNENSFEIERGTAGANAAKRRDDRWNPENIDLSWFEAKPKRIAGPASLCVKQEVRNFGHNTWSRTQGPNIQQVATTECEPRFENESLAEWRRQMDKDLKNLFQKGPIEGAGRDDELNDKFGRSRVGTGRRKMKNHYRKVKR